VRLDGELCSWYPHCNPSLSQVVLAHDASGSHGCFFSSIPSRHRRQPRLPPASWNSTLHPPCRACRLPLSALRLPCVHMECRRIFFFCMTRRRQRRRQRRPGRWHNDSGTSECCLLLAVFTRNIYGITHPVSFTPYRVHSLFVAPNWLGASHLIPFSQ